MAARSRYGSEVPPLLGYGVRIPPGVWMSVCYECCQVEVSATSRALIGSPTECGASKRGLETSTMRRLRPSRAVIYIYLVESLSCCHSRSGVSLKLQSQRAH